MTDLDRRYLLALLGTSLVAPRAAFAAFSPAGLEQRLSETEQRGKVVGLACVAGEPMRRACVRALWPG